MEPLIEQALAALDNKQSSVATGLLQQAFEADPRSSRAVIAYARTIAFINDEADKAIQVLEAGFRVVIKHPFFSSLTLCHQN